MTYPDLTVRMLGEFSISLGGQSITDNSNRSRKAWLLLAYLISVSYTHLTLPTT